ncbi:AAA family ATPase [Catellatospora sp. NPDC049609]|uniref:helix-turn-helix transcriptional regulator n=1 Tax=Catellatospora sp. NPDC049609 TaxID=3155505 RepID=UPI00342E76AB
MGVVLLGRGREQQVLEDAVDGCRSGAGGFVLVEAPAGMGKSALLGFARGACRQADLRVLTARAVDLEREFAFGVVRQLFEPVLARVDAPARARLLSGAAGVAATVLGAGEVSEGPPPGEFALLHGLFWLTANLCQDKPLALLADDLHWADIPSLRYLSFLQPRLSELGLLVVATTRLYEPGAPAQQLAQLAADPACVVLRPGPLGADAVGQLVRARLGETAEQGFVDACAKATSGNPLLLRELLHTLAEDKVAPVADSVPLVCKIGSRAVSGWVGARLATLDPQHLALAHALTVLGEQGLLTEAATLADISIDVALAGMNELERLDIIAVTEPKSAGEIQFVSPLLRSTVYDTIDPVHQARAHRQAAELRASQKADAEQIAAHLLRVPPAGEDWARTALFDAATLAMTRASPDSAVAYLKRMLEEPLDAQAQFETLVSLGEVAQFTSTELSISYLKRAYAQADNSVSRAKVAAILGAALFYEERNDEALDIYQTSLEALSSQPSDLRQELEAGLLDMALDDPMALDLMQHRLDELKAAPPNQTPVGRTIDCLIALRQAFALAGASDVTRRALGALSGEELYMRGMRTIFSPTRISAYCCGIFALAATDHSASLPLLDRHMREATKYGSIPDMEAALSYRGMQWLWQGALAEATADSHEAVRIIEKGFYPINVPYVRSVRVNALLEQGCLTEAGEALEGVDLSRPTRCGHWFLLHEARARLLLARHDYELALAGMIEAGERFGLTGGRNPAFCAWRSGAAECMHALGRHDEARRYASEELELARAWGAPRALGRALRVAGLVIGGREGLALLHEAVETLASSPARLEYAKALVDLGAATRRAGHATAARPYLAQGLDLATQCGAIPVVEHARRELIVTGARPRRTELTGPAALTPSEQRVVELAAQGHSNRDIAQQLFVTVKTVEVHLGSAYRKLGITRRAQLATSLAGQPA